MKTCLGTTQPRITDFFKNQNFVLKADLPHSWTFPEDWHAQICNPRTFCGGVGIIINFFYNCNLKITFDLVVRFLFCLVQWIRLGELDKVGL